MEFKVYKDDSERARNVCVDIATEWNLKVISLPFSSLQPNVDIATEWNLKCSQRITNLIPCSVDIATEWNLKINNHFVFDFLHL